MTVLKIMLSTLFAIFAVIYGIICIGIPWVMYVKATFVAMNLPFPLYLSSCITVAFFPVIFVVSAIIAYNTKKKPLSKIQEII